MDSLNLLKITEDKLTLYSAGYPGYKARFARDGLISALLIADSNMLRDQLIFCATRQGGTKNPLTGEEPGKIFHEYPGVPIDKLSFEYLACDVPGLSSLGHSYESMKGKSLTTEYNACDTTALFLIGHESYVNLTNDSNLLHLQETNIKKAVGYILGHIKNDLFIESPSFCGADKFALKVSYWKDSQLLDRPNGQPAYPIVYSLAHIQNTRALKSAARLLGEKELGQKAEAMAGAIGQLYDSENEVLYIAKDELGVIRGVTTDSLHALYYLDREDVSLETINGFVASSVTLETAAGYRTMSPDVAEKMIDKYHANTVWPFEQAIIHAGAKKFGLDSVVKMSERVVPYLDTDPEILIIRNDGSIKKGGCDPQLWTIAAKSYFGRLLVKENVAPEITQPVL